MEEEKEEEEEEATAAGAYGHAAPKVMSWVAGPGGAPLGGAASPAFAGASASTAGAATSRPARRKAEWPPLPDASD